MTGSRWRLDALPIIWLGAAVRSRRPGERGRGGVAASVPESELYLELYTALYMHSATDGAPRPCPWKRGVRGAFSE